MYQELNSCWLYACIISDTMFCWRRNPREHMDNAYPYVFRLPWLCVPVSFCTDIMQAYHFMSNSLVFCLSDEAQLVHLGWCDATLLTFDNSQISPVDQKCSIFCIAYLLKAFMSNLAESSFFDKWWSHFGISLLLSNIIRGTNVTLIYDLKMILQVHRHSVSQLPLTDTYSGVKKCLAPSWFTSVLHICHT